MSHENLRASAKIITKAKELGASLTGWASIEDLKNGPSAYRRDEFENVGHRMDDTLKLKHGEILWRPEAKSVLAIALHHPEDKPEMDWWMGRTNPPGNKMLMRIIKQLCAWITEEYGFQTFHLPYQVGKGGLYLKDACVLAGLGCVGANNMLVTPQYGPRVRLRALTIDVEMPSTGPIAFNPCKGCDQPCRRVCPQKAISKKVYEPKDYEGLEKLPGQDGYYSVATCDIQNAKDVENAKVEQLVGMSEPAKILRFCRKCELSCPVGA